MVNSGFLTEGFLRSCPQVSSTTHQLMEEMDHALKGVWPYDKKEDEDSYHRKNSRTDDDPHDIIQVLDSEPQQQQSLSPSKRKSQVHICGVTDYMVHDRTVGFIVLPGLFFTFFLLFLIYGG